MSNITQISAQGPAGEPAKKTVPAPNQEIVIGQQVGTLLAAANTCILFIANYNPENEASPGGHTDGGTRMAAETSLIKILSRLDSIVDDPGCWGTAHLGRMEAQLLAVYQEQREAIQAQRKAFEIMSAPQSRLGPQLLALPNGNWAAFIGRPGTDSCILGVGACAEDALADFDRSFGRVSPEQRQAAIIKAHINKTIVVEQYEKQTLAPVDSSRTNLPPNPPSGGEKSSTDSRRSRAKPKHCLG